MSQTKTTKITTCLQSLSEFFIFFFAIFEFFVKLRYSHGK